MVHNHLWPADLAPAAIRAGVGYWPSLTLAIRNRIDSTNDAVLRTTGERGLLVADAQWGGRGRRGRGWASPPGGNLYWSLRMPRADFSLPPGWLPLLAGLAVVRALDGLGVAGLGLKWPNDVLDPTGAKLGGILCEGHGPWWVIGVGLNVAVPPVAGASALARLGHAELSRGLLAGALVRSMRQWGLIGGVVPTEPPREEWRQRAALPLSVLVHPTNGSPWPGRALDLDDQGRLRVIGQGGETCLSGEECSLRLEGGV